MWKRHVVFLEASKTPRFALKPRALAPGDEIDDGRWVVTEVMPATGASSEVFARRAPHPLLPLLTYLVLRPGSVPTFETISLRRFLAVGDRLMLSDGRWIVARLRPRQGLRFHDGVLEVQRRERAT